MCLRHIGREKIGFYEKKMYLIYIQLVNFKPEVECNVNVLLLCLCASSYQYLAPEVLRKQPYDNTVDWWCLGSVLYEMLFGLVSFNFGPTVCIHCFFGFFSLVGSLDYFCKQSFLDLL